MIDNQAKALAHFIFREVIEEAHSKYGISQDDIRAMCRQAVNNAAFFLEMEWGGGHFKGTDTATALKRFYYLNGLYGVTWDEPEWTDDHEQLFHVLTAEL